MFTQPDTTFSVFLKDEAATMEMGALFCQAQPSGMVYLLGNLGAGKSCFARAVIHAAGFVGTVKSPTYTLVEPYELPTIHIYHFDLYRLKEEEELLFLGCDDYFSKENLCLVEWPEKAAGVLPSADIKTRIEPAVQDGQHGRFISFEAGSALGQLCLDRLKVLVRTF